MRQHVYKIVDNHIQLVLQKIGDTLHQLAPILGIEHLVVRMLDVQPMPPQILVKQLILELVLETLLVFIHPILRVLALNLRRHQPAEHGIARKLCGGGDNAIIHAILLRAQILLYGRLQIFPLVIAEIVYHNQECRAVLFQQGKQLLPQYGGAQQRLVHIGRGIAQPVHIILLIELTEQLVGLSLLRREYLVDIVVIGGAQFQVPVHQFAIQLHPLVVSQPSRQFHSYLAKLLLIRHRAAFALQSPGIGVLLDGQQYLIGVDRLDKIVADLPAEGFIHDVLLLALGYHDNRNLGVARLNLCKGVKAAQSRHILVKKHNVYTLAVFL